MPVLPLLRKERKVDIIIMLDSSSPTSIASTYKYVNKEKQYIEDLRSLPSGYEEDKLRGLKVIYQHYMLKGKEDEPICLYMPLKNNELYQFKSKEMKELSETGGFPNFGTFKLHYTEEEVEELMSLCAFNMKEAIPSLIDEIRKLAL